MNILQQLLESTLKTDWLEIQQKLVDYGFDTKMISATRMLVNINLKLNNRIRTVKHSVVIHVNRKGKFYLVAPDEADEHESFEKGHRGGYDKDEIVTNVLIDIIETNVATPSDSAINIWMDDNKKKELAIELINGKVMKTVSFNVSSKSSARGTMIGSKQKYWEEKGWVLFAVEDNYDSIEMVFLKS